MATLCAENAARPLAPLVKGGREVGRSTAIACHSRGSPPLAPPCKGGKVGRSTAIDVTRLRLTPPSPPFQGGDRARFSRCGRRAAFVCAIEWPGPARRLRSDAKKRGASPSPVGKRDRADRRKRAGEAVRARLAARAAAVGSRGNGRHESSPSPASRSNRRRSDRPWATFSFATTASGPPRRVRATCARFHYQLEPAHAGKHLIRSVSIEFVDKRPNSERRGEPALIETDPLEVNVTSELGDEAPSLANLEPMLPPQPVPQTFRDRLAGRVGPGRPARRSSASWSLRRRKRRPIEPRRQTPEEIAQAALALLLAENLPGRGLVKEFYLRLTGIVRQYVEDTTGIRAPEQTTEEFLRDMRSRAAFPPERSVRLAEFLEAADLIKYAGQQPEEGQIDQAIARAHEFVNLKPSPAAVMAGAMRGLRMRSRGARSFP